MHPRRGYTLIEAALAISMVALVLAGIAVMLQSVMRSSRAMQSHRGSMNAIQRVATQFREDVHQAASAEPGEGKLSLGRSQGETIVYAIVDNAIERTVNSNGKVVHRDGFDLPPLASVKFETDANSENRLVSLIVDYPLDTSQPEMSNRRTLRIDAALSRSHAPRGNALPRRSASPTSE